MRTVAPKHAPLVDRDQVQWRVIEAGLRRVADDLPRVGPALRDDLSAYAVRFDAQVRRIRRDRAAGGASVAGV